MRDCESGLSVLLGSGSREMWFVVWVHMCAEEVSGGVGREGRGSYSCGANSWSCPGKQDQPGQVEGGEARGHDPGGGLRERLHKEVHLQKPRGGRASIRLWNQTLGPFFPQCTTFPRCFASILLNTDLWLCSSSRWRSITSRQSTETVGLVSVRHISLLFIYSTLMTLQMGHETHKMLIRSYVWQSVCVRAHVYVYITFEVKSQAQSSKASLRKGRWNIWERIYHTHH